MEKNVLKLQFYKSNILNKQYQEQNGLNILGRKFKLRAFQMCYVFSWERECH